jgi:pimeloyl-ACP methyl ester carboxylesterase
MPLRLDEPMVVGHARGAAIALWAGLTIPERLLRTVRIGTSHSEAWFLADRARRLGKVYQSSPIALRFVKASPAYLSMMHGHDTMMMELIQLRGNDGGYEMLGAYEEALYALGGRPHWGQVNTLTGSHGLVASMYPRYEDWQRVHRELNASGYILPGLGDAGDRLFGTR